MNRVVSGWTRKRKEKIGGHEIDISRDIRGTHGKLSLGIRTGSSLHDGITPELTGDRRSSRRVRERKRETGDNSHQGGVVVVTREQSLYFRTGTGLRHPSKIGEISNRS